jgi:pyruvate,water dikinase
MKADSSTILPFTSSEATLLIAGGKGANLARLTRAGLPVPRGFIVATSAYRTYVEVNHLDDALRRALEGLAADDAAQLEKASGLIRRAFSAGKMPGELEAVIRTASAEFKDTPVAVRSSATAEDLPDLSFAGQQDTYLNIIGADSLIKAVVDCWSSLWTARAIGYRLRNQIDHHEAALAVVVQAMIPGEVSGVLFTANPLTGLLNETVIEATFGLGEALVSGQVEPDHYVVNSLSGAILEKTVGSKKIATRGKAGGGIEVVQEEAGARQTLTEDEVRQITALGQQVQKEYGAPQDIEWALADGKLWLLQARAITSLFPIPVVSFDPLRVWISFGAVQGLVGPITPLGRDAIRHLIANAGRMFGLKLDPDTFSLFAAAGERIWINFSDVIRNPIGSRVFGELLPMIEPSVWQILDTLAADPRFGKGKGRVKFSTLWRMAGFGLPILARMARNMLQPETARARFDAAIDGYLSKAAITPAADRTGRLANIVAFMKNRTANVFQVLLPQFIPIFGPSMGALNFLNAMAGEDAPAVMEITRGLPNNVTTEMDLALWETAVRLKKDAKAADVFQKSDASTLAASFLSGSLPAAAQSVIADFLNRYGMRGVGEIDFGQPRWREDPAPIMHTLKSYLTIDPDFAPNVVFERGERAAEAAIEKLAVKVRGQAFGGFKEKLVRGAARRIRLLMGARESPKFFAVKTMGIARSAMLETGREFAEAGVIERADDLVFLRLSELEALARNEPRDWKALIASRRDIYGRELRRKQVPRVLVSDGRTFYEGLGAETDTGDVISGSPVSAGVAEGIVHVVLDPRTTQLAPGEILVCPGTDPAWTPLFMAAGGLVTEVGGMMTHGSVVAREYGIPAVVGVHQATLRLKDGQRIRVDGTTGKITLLGE